MTRHRLDAASISRWIGDGFAIAFAQAGEPLPGVSEELPCD
jgi:hypothetical protein